MRVWTPLHPCLDTWSYFSFLITFLWQILQGCFAVVTYGLSLHFIKLYVLYQIDEMWNRTFRNISNLFKLKWYSGLKNCLDIYNYNAALCWYTCTQAVYALDNDIWVTLEKEIKFIYITEIDRWQQYCYHWWVGGMAQFISAYAEINWATGNWQLIGNYAILAKNSHRVFLYENGELNGV